MGQSRYTGLPTEFLYDVVTRLLALISHDWVSIRGMGWGGWVQEGSGAVRQANLWRVCFRRCIVSGPGLWVSNKRLSGDLRLLLRFFEVFDLCRQSQSPRLLTTPPTILPCTITARTVITSTSRPTSPTAHGQIFSSAQCMLKKRMRLD